MRYNDLQSMRKEDDTYSLITISRISAGSLVHIMVAEAEKRTRYTIECDGRHYIDEKIMYMNHSCDPSCEIVGREIIAKRDINAFGELTFDYATTETHILDSFKCKCGSRECRGLIYK